MLQHDSVEILNSLIYSPETNKQKVDVLRTIKMDGDPVSIDINALRATARIIF